MQHGVVPRQDRKVLGLVGCIEAQTVAEKRHRRRHVADRKSRNGSMEASGSPRIKT
jgi:hypothetical protein